MDTEIYSVDYNQNLKLCVYGGNDLKCTVSDTVNNLTVFAIEGFTESVIFCRFLKNDAIIICTLDGNITVTFTDKEIFSTNINEEITCATISDSRIFVGTSLFNIYSFDFDLSNQRLYFGHSSEIQELLCIKDRLYSLSEYAFISYNVEACTQLMKHKLMKSICFSVIPNTDICCIGTEDAVLIFNSVNLIEKIALDGHPETVFFINNYFVVGGYLDHILVINTRMNMKNYKISIESAGINKFISGGEFLLYFSTLCGFVGRCDIRKDDSMELFETKVETIFDFCVYESTFFVGGLKGYDLVRVEEFE